MCGIAGYITSSGQKYDFKKVIKNMTNKLVHRGPDSGGFYINKFFAFGHRRLSIIDLSKGGAQPMVYKNRYVIVYNGEIYNYLEIKNFLIKKGYNFLSSSDTEVVLAAYDYWKVDCLKKFNGMWALVIYDKLKDEIFISRDRFGKKPLFYYQSNQSFIFASEAKSLLEHPSVKKELNKNAIKNYIHKGSRSYREETFFNNIKSFPSSRYLLVKKKDIFKKIKFRYYWKIKPNLSKENFCIKKAKVLAKKYFDILDSSVKLRLRADVDVGSCLSGGLDSSCITYLILKNLNKNKSKNKLKTFSTVYNSPETSHYDESSFVKDLSKRLDYKNYQYEPKNFKKNLNKIIYYFEDPPTRSGMTVWSIFDFIKKKSNIKVTLDGQGADEQLGGYLSYIPIYLSNLSIKNFIYEFLKFFNLPDAKKYVLKGLILKILIILFGKKITQLIIKKIFKINYSFDLNTALCKDLQTNLINLLKYSDRSSMGNSIEARMPFLDFRLVEFLASVPSCYKLHNGWTKYLARIAFDKKLPNSICWRKDKMGWLMPEQYWLDQNKKWCIMQISSSKLVSKLFQKNIIKNYSKINYKMLIKNLNLSIFEKTYFNKSKI